jgi:crotonobetainyl-CoA:carnitine CoA-transferase CaiB-like acyl-CoA transferase
VNHLREIDVLDMSHALAGPTAGAILADLGARVIKLEHPHGDHFRPLLGGAYYAAVNRNKRGISLDLKKPESREVVQKLIRKSDVLLESFTPGTMESLGLGYATVKELNPRLIYCSISGFGQNGPYSKLPGYDVVAQAMCGIMMCTGMPDGPPVRIGASWVDMGAGMYSVIGILKALMDRGETNRGRHIDVSLMDTALSWMSPLIARYSMSGDLPQRIGSAFAPFSPYQVFSCKDGYVFIGASTDRFWQALCKLLKIEHLLNDLRFATNENRIKHRKELTKLIEAALATVDRDQLVENLRAIGMPCGPVLDVGQVLQDQQVSARGVLMDWAHPEFDRVIQVKTPIAEDKIMPEIHSPSPFLGQHTREVLSELNYSQLEVDKMIQSGVAIEAVQIDGRIERRPFTEGPVSKAATS